jgi:hypothetical protein
MARSLSEAVLADVRTEVISFGRAGDGLRRGIETMLDEAGPGERDGDEHESGDGSGDDE